MFFSTAQPEHCSIFLISLKLFSTHLDFSACYTVVYCQGEILAHKNQCAEFLRTEAGNTDAFTQRNFHTQTVSVREKRLHKARFSKQVLTHSSKLLHWKVFTQRSFCAQQVFTQTNLQTETFTHGSFYTEKFLHTKFLHPELFTC